jgi:hypothetical protein
MEPNLHVGAFFLKCPPCKSSGQCKLGSERRIEKENEVAGNSPILASFWVETDPFVDLLFGNRHRFELCSTKGRPRGTFLADTQILIDRVAQAIDVILLERLHSPRMPISMGRVIQCPPPEGGFFVAS